MERIGNLLEKTQCERGDISQRKRSIYFEEVKSLLFRLDETPENFTGRIIFMSMFNDISCGSKDNEQECLANAKLVSLDAKRCGKGQWSFIGPGSEKKWYSKSEDSPQGIWDKIAERMLLEFAESGCPIFRVTTPLSRGKDGGRYSSFCIINGHKSSEKCWTGGKAPKVQRSSCSGDIVKDDSGSYAVFTEQGSSASQMTTAKIMDIISRLPGCDGQAADAVSAYTQIKMEDAHK